MKDLPKELQDLLKDTSELEAVNLRLAYHIGVKNGLEKAKEILTK